MNTPPFSSPLRGYSLFLWLTFLGGTLFLIWQCLDRYLAPRFLFVSVALLVALFWSMADLRKRGDWTLNGFDLLLLGWYGINLASAFSAFSWSEGVFFAQKTLLLFVVYWFLRQALWVQSDMVQRTLAHITIGLTWIISSVLIVQLGMAIREKGLDNDTLYIYASGIFGNKGLASDFLFFLLVLQVLFSKHIGVLKTRINVVLLLALILLLQTRTVYLAVVGSGLFYMIGRALSEPTFRPIFLKKVLPASGLLIAGLLAILVYKNDGSSLVERLNPLSWMESASANERRFVWYKTDLLCADHYWWGVGNGSWKLWLPSKSIEGAYRLQEKGIVFTRAHNDYLEIRAEMGIIGASWFIALFIAAGMALLFTLWKKQGPSQEILATGAGLLGYCIIQYFDFPRERIEMQVMLALFLGFSVYYSRDIWEKLPVLSIRKANLVFIAAIVIGLCYNLVIGWYRVRGEIHNVAMIKAYNKQDYPTVLKEARLAKNAFLEYTDVMLPFEWYEGSSYYKTNNSAAALKSFERALQLNPWNFQVLNNYASALAASGKYQDAIPHFEKAIQINPKYDEGKFNLAYCYMQLNQSQKALDWVNKADTIPNPQTPDELKKNKMVKETKAAYLDNILKNL